MGWIFINLPHFCQLFHSIFLLRFIRKSNYLQITNLLSRTCFDHHMFLRNFQQKIHRSHLRNHRCQIKLPLQPCIHSCNFHPCDFAFHLFGQLQKIKISLFVTRYILLSLCSPIDHSYRLILQRLQTPRSKFGRRRQLYLYTSSSRRQIHLRVWMSQQIRILKRREMPWCHRCLRMFRWLWKLWTRKHRKLSLGNLP